MRFLGLGLSDRVPDAKTIWMFRERLTRAGAIDRLFRRFDAARGGDALRFAYCWAPCRSKLGTSINQAS